MTFDLTPCGDSALAIRVGPAPDESTRLRIHAMLQGLGAAALAGVTDIVPGFTTITLHYDPMTTSWENLAARVDTALAHATEVNIDEGRLVHIPVCYGGQFGPDLDSVATLASLTASDVIALHAMREYHVDLLGFLPGFAYLGGLDPRIAVPRLATPRDRVPAGSVGIAGVQTGVYPLESPGGWQLIGRSPITLFDPSRTPPTLLAPGDRVRFVAIDRAEFDRLRAVTT